jgi:4,5-dihydroxyphthalate decarboxylase
MADVKITFACGPYDRMEALKSGAVKPEGIDLQFVSIRSPRTIFDKMGGRNPEFDSSEFSASEYVSQYDRGDCQFIALPVFPSICFRHSFIYYNRRAGIRKPKDLEGKRIGTPLYTQTAAVWIRGILTHEYGVDFSKVTWVQGAMEKVGTHGTPSAPDLLKPVKIERAPADKSVSDLLESGAVDATLGSRGPDPISDYPSVARLFPDYRAVERDYFRRTRICPIMHTVVLKKSIYEKNPWIAESLYKALEESRRRALEDMKYPGALRFMLPWLGDDLDEIEDVFGGDPWPYGLEAQRPTMEALVQYLAEQNFIKAKIPLEKLFVKV